MPRESLAEKKVRTLKITEGLRQAYPDAHCELNFTNPLQLLVATILSAQSTDKQVNLVTADLFKKYRSAQAFAEADLEELQRDIQRLGFFRNKAKSIKACGQQLVERHKGEVPRTMEELTALAGVGRKTANVVLGNAFGINTGVVVDTHVTRLSKRLGLSRHDLTEKIEQDLMKLVPQKEWTVFSHRMIYHGRAVCVARKPKCRECLLNPLCPSAEEPLE
jgi:endonuclease III